MPVLGNITSCPSSTDYEKHSLINESRAIAADGGVAISFSDGYANVGLKGKMFIDSMVKAPRESVAASRSKLSKYNEMNANRGHYTGAWLSGVTDPTSEAFVKPEDRTIAQCEYVPSKLQHVVTFKLGTSQLVGVENQSLVFNLSGKTALEYIPYWSLDLFSGYLSPRDYSLAFGPIAAFERSSAYNDKKEVYSSCVESAGDDSDAVAACEEKTPEHIRDQQYLEKTKYTTGYKIGLKPDDASDANLAPLTFTHKFTFRTLNESEPGDSKSTKGLHSQSISLGSTIRSDVYKWYVKPSVDFEINEGEDFQYSGSKDNGRSFEGAIVYAINPSVVKGFEDQVDDSFWQFRLIHNREWNNATVASERSLEALVEFQHVMPIFGGTPASLGDLAGETDTNFIATMGVRRKVTNSLGDVGIKDANGEHVDIDNCEEFFIDSDACAPEGAELPKGLEETKIEIPATLSLALPASMWRKAPEELAKWRVRASASATFAPQAFSDIFTFNLGDVGKNMSGEFIRFSVERPL